MSMLSIAGFTNVGYRLHSRRFDPIDVDLSGRTVVITGATGGLGKAAASALAGLGARLVVVGRDPSKLATLGLEIGGEVVPVQADLSLMADVRRLAQILLETEPRLDVLINNVGVLIPRRSTTDEGLEMTLATNLAGHFLLTNMLIPRLVESAPARIVNVSSGGMYSERLRPDDLEYAGTSYRGSSAYARTKRGQVVLTEMWADRLAGSGVVVHSMHPGWAATAGVEQSLPTFNRLMRPLLRTPEEGADTIVWLAAAEAPGESTGRFWFDRAVAPTHLSEKTMEEPGDRQALWDGLSRITGSDLPDIRHLTAR
jgi:NAD(P)-dependent dehydrogenase (short-subunit alcohol dehydrogenase family)